MFRIIVTAGIFSSFMALWGCQNKPSSSTPIPPAPTKPPIGAPTHDHEYQEGSKKLKEEVLRAKKNMENVQTVLDRHEYIREVK